MKKILHIVAFVLFAAINAFAQKEVQIFSNPSFAGPSLAGWYWGGKLDVIAENDPKWGEGLSDNLRCFPNKSKWMLTHSTKVLPAGIYNVTFNYNGTVDYNNNFWSTEADMTGVTASIGSVSVPLTSCVDAGDEIPTATVVFEITEPKAVTLQIEFAEGNNATWFAIDNIRTVYTGNGVFEDMTSSVPAFGGENWIKVDGNTSGAYTETKLGSNIYNGSGLAYWNSSAPKETDFFMQDIVGLPAGKYGVSAFAAANLWDGDDARNNQRGSFLYAKTESDSKSVEITTPVYGLYSVVIDVKGDETLTVGMNAGADNGNNWCYLSEVKLVRLCEETTVSLTITEAGMATLILPFEAEIPECVKAYSCASLTGNVLNLEEAETFEANTPYIVEGIAGTYSFTGVGIADEESYINGLLTGNLSGNTIYAPLNSYILLNGESGVGFYRVVTNDVTINNNRVYLTLPAGEVKSFISFGDATAINGVEDVEDATVVESYNATGVKVVAPVKGLNIVKLSNGKIQKVLVK